MNRVNLVVDVFESGPLTRALFACAVLALTMLATGCGDDSSSQDTHTAADTGQDSAADASDTPGPEDTSPDTDDAIITPDTGAPDTISDMTLPDSSTGPSCGAYCASFVPPCTGGDAPYANEAACLTYCETAAKLPPGEANALSGNSIGCRMSHAGLANRTGDPSHCESAGPSGGNVCGTWCDNYCHLAMNNCNGVNALFANETDCHTACANFPSNGSVGDMSGDTVQCRITHLGFAGSDPANGSEATHCPHGGFGGGVCE